MYCTLEKDESEKVITTTQYDNDKYSNRSFTSF